MPSLNLPNPPDKYMLDWANQYTRALEQKNQEVWNIIQGLMTYTLPSYTTAQKVTLTNRAGQLVFDTTLGKACINTGSGWQTITST